MNAPIEYAEQSPYGRLITILQKGGQHWIINRLEHARIEKLASSLTIDEIHEAFGDPDLNPRKADYLITAIAQAGLL
jgi:hypothetical protein